MNKMRTAIMRATIVLTIIMGVLYVFAPPFGYGFGSSVDLGLFVVLLGSFAAAGFVLFANQKKKAGEHKLSEKIEIAGVAFTSAMLGSGLTMVVLDVQF